jgi:hypothetical protein
MKWSENNFFYFLGRIQSRNPFKIFMYLWPTYYTLEFRVYEYIPTPSILACFTDSERFQDFFLRDVIFS